MKSFTLLRGGAISAIIVAALCVPQSCQYSANDGPRANLSLQIACDPDVASPTTKSATLDTDDFILKVTDSKGNIVYSGLFGASPEQIIVAAGTYTIQTWSSEFSAPLFDAPQYGDTEVVVMKEGETKNVTLYCSQINAGVKLNVHPDFLSDYPDGVLFLKSSEGKLMYSYNEKRIAYFQPGAVSLILSQSGKETTVFTRNLEPRQILYVTLSVAGGSGGAQGTKGGISIQIDTSRNWTSESYTIGQEGGGGSSGDGSDNAYTVAQAREHTGEQDVWVCGYIVGGDLSSSRCSFEPPFVARTNLVLAGKSNCTDKEVCLSVQLAKGDVRDDINLVDHEEYLGRKIWLKGDIVDSYYGIPGLQCITEYQFK